MSLYNKIIDLQKLGQAWDKVRKNKPAAGVDQVTYDIFESRRKEELYQLYQELLEHRYESLPVRMQNIYKGEKVRKIALFSMRDKVVQQSLARELGKFFEPLFSKTAYAYRPGQSALSALQKIEEQVKNGTDIWILQMDIKDFFDCIQHSILSDMVADYVREQDVMDLLDKILKTSVLEENTGELRQNLVGVFQGSGCAPLLSNIYLMDYDSEMESRSDFYIRYSDDILVIERDKERAEKLYDFSKLYMEKKGLELKETKTRIFQLGEDSSFAYLGYEFTPRGKSIPVKAVSSLNSRLETLWLTTGLGIDEKLEKGRAILGGWEQYYRGERSPGHILEYVIILSMVLNKDEKIRRQIEGMRSACTNYYKDVALYMLRYWKNMGNNLNAVREAEEFYQLPEEDDPHIAEHGKLVSELMETYETMLTDSSEELLTNIMQLYTDMKCYKKAAFIWDMRSSQYESDKYMEVEQPADLDEKVCVRSGDLQEYISLFVGREDTYAKEVLWEGRQRRMEQIFEPVTEDVLRQHLDGSEILGTYVQRPNNTAKYVVFDIDISKKILLQYQLRDKEFSGYKKQAARIAECVCKILKRMGIKGYIEDSGYRGYHVWIFFMEWIPVRYINELADCIQKELYQNINEHENITMEIFPNRARIKAGKCGHCIHLPLGKHIITGRRSIFLSTDFMPVEDYHDFLSGISKVSLPALKRILGTYALNTSDTSQEKEVDKNLERFAPLPESVRIVLDRCNLMRYLCQKAASTGYLSHFERMSVLYVFGHMGDEGKEFVHTVMGFTLNYQYAVTQKFINKLLGKPVSCVKLREQYKLITAEYGCSCNFKRTKDCYPSPVLHAIQNIDDEKSMITAPVSRSIAKSKEQEVYEEINIHKQAEKLAQRIVEMKKQKRGLDKSIRKIETELQKIFDNSRIDCLEISMGLLVRRKKEDNGYEWLIEL